MTMSITKVKVEQIVRGNNTIVAVRPLPDFEIELRYSDGTVYIIDFKPIIKGGGVMSALADSSVFNAVKVAHDGIAIEFPGKIDFCADSLRIDGELQKTG